MKANDSFCVVPVFGPFYPLQCPPTRRNPADRDLLNFVSTMVSAVISGAGDVASVAGLPGG